MGRKLLSTFIAVLAAAIMLAGCASDSGTGTGTTGSTDATIPETSVNASTDAATGTTPSAGYTFAVCGDNRIEGINNGVLGRIIASAKSRGAAFMVDTGDVTTSGSRQQLETFRQYTEAEGLTFHSVPGNHDVGSGGVSDAWDEIIGPLYYSFDYQGDHFVVVDNADDATGISEAQMQWYTADLDAHASDPRTFVFAHIPVADPGLESGHATGEKGQTGLESGKQMIDEASRAHTAAFFFGHVHAYLQYQLDNIPAYVTGGAGAPLVLPSAAGGYYHYLLVTVGASGVNVEVVRV